MKASVKLTKELSSSVEDCFNRNDVNDVFRSLVNICPPQTITSETQHADWLKAAEVTAEWLHKLGDDPKNKYLCKGLEQYLDVISTLIERWESRKFEKVGKASGADVLKYLMELKHLRQVDLRQELGGQSVVSEILSGDRDLNLSQVRALAKRFNVSPAVFIGA